MGLIRLLVQHRDALGRYGKYGKLVLPFNWWFMMVSPWLLAATVVVTTGASVSLIGIGGLVVPGAIGIFAYLGQKDLLGPVQALYSIFDTQVSLLRASLELLIGDSDGTWDVDAELREAFE